MIGAAAGLDTLLLSGLDPTGLVAEFLLCRRSCADLDARQLKALGFDGLDSHADQVHDEACAGAVDSLISELEEPRRRCVCSIRRTICAAMCSSDRAEPHCRIDADSSRSSARCVKGVAVGA